MCDKGVVLAIVGSRNMKDKDLFNKTIKEFVLEYGIPQRIVSGGAKGADKMGEAWGHKMKLPVTSFRSDWKQYKKAAGVMRNTDIVRECSHMIAFPSKSGRGTQDSIKKAKIAGKILTIKWI